MIPIRRAIQNNVTQTPLLSVPGIRGTGLASTTMLIGCIVQVPPDFDCDDGWASIGPQKEDQQE